jgi:hypothetical protein
MTATQERAAKYIGAEQVQWGTLIKNAGIKNE